MKKKALLESILSNAEDKSYASRDLTGAVSPGVTSKGEPESTY